MKDEVGEEPQLNHDNLNWYLNEIAKIKTLTSEEEKALGHAIQRGDPDAINRMAEANLRFVVTICKKYRGLGLSFLDLLNEGNIGLIEAAKRYDPEKNVKFITYAVWWIRQAIIHAIAKQSGTFRLPQKQANLLYQINKKIQEFSQRTQRDPTAEELSKELNIPVGEVEMLLNISSENISLSDNLVEGNDFQVLDTLEQEYTHNIDESLIQEAFEQQVKHILNEMDEKERKVIKLRFGLSGGEPMTLREIGDYLNLSRERIRQIENTALRKLRQNSAIQELRNYLT